MSMQKSSMFHYFKFAISCLIILSLMTGCEKDKVTEPEAEPPMIPPLSSFLMDFTDFISEGSAAKTQHDQAVLTKNNWGWAALNVAVWNSLITLGLAVPVAAYANSFNDSQPDLLEDGTFVWIQEYTTQGKTYTAKLHGKLVGVTVQWKMYVSEEDGYQDFLWYTGESDLYANEGFWILNKSPSEPVSLLNITWHHNPESETGDIKYTNIEPGGPENGGYIFYGINNGSPYDAFYDVYNMGKDNHTLIEWNRTTREGRVKDMLHFGDDEWHLWDSDLEDI
jgi:hypothetical protein